ncbi:Resolvase, N terminal domain [Pseudonocardia oroxyli]|uniref:Resolvase, N terminal domain n=1 Tax=Pseudonocardia oroxyli TaxID=366584 RepID=A0A1G7UK78_PSEOR|nr:Resolvase, N terminal domain [Pseudonocardia oroxyli]
MRYLSELIELAGEHGKDIVSTTEAFELGSPLGKGMIYFIGVFAEMEWDAISERVTDSQRELRKVGRYRGGPVPYGYRKVKADPGWHLEEDPETADIVRDLVDRYLGGESLSALARSLNDDGIPSPKGGQWATSSLSVLLRSRALIGQSTHKGAVVVGANGLPVQRAEPLITAARWHDLQDELAKGRNRPAGAKSGPPKLLRDILFCGACGSKMYHQKTSSRGRFYTAYWRCSAVTHPRADGPRCSEPYVPASSIEGQAVELAKVKIGHIPRTVEVYREAEGPAEELAVVEDALRIARKERDEGLYVGEDDAYLNRVRGLIATRDELRKMPSRPARMERIASGGTWGEALDAAESPEETRAILLMTGMRLTAKNRGIDVGVSFDEGIIAAAFPAEVSA